MFSVLTSASISVLDNLGKIYSPKLVTNSIAFAGLLLSGFIAINGILNNSESTSDIYGWLFLPGLFLLFAAPLLLTSYNSRAVVDSNKVVQRNIFRRERAIKYSEIESVSFSKATQYLTLDGQGKRVRVHLTLRGFQNLLEILKTKLPQTTTEKAFRDIENYRTPE